MKKKLYEKPTMNVVVIQHTQMLMTASLEGSHNTYTKASAETWEEQ